MEQLMVLVLMLSSFCVVGVVSQGQLEVDFYSEKCPSAEKVVTNVVRAAVLSDRKMGARILRLYFHDCFVQGCDGSILIDNGPDSDVEINTIPHQGLGGFDVIQEAKAQLEISCPEVVSCADIVALVARDAIALANEPVRTRFKPVGEMAWYRILSWHLELANDMPDVDDSIAQLKEKFLSKGLNEKDLVILSAAPTSGTTTCFFMTKRLYYFSGEGPSDPSINSLFLGELKSTCLSDGSVNTRLPLDHKTEFNFDKQSLHNIKEAFMVLASDARLNDNATTRRIVNSNLIGPNFERDFVESITKIGKIGVITGSQGEIRANCSAFN